jgi:hypothetical protein
MSDAADLSLAAFALCYGGASPDDYHLAATLIAIDGDILEVLAERERRKRRKRERRCRSR